MTVEEAEQVMKRISDEKKQKIQTARERFAYVSKYSEHGNCELCAYGALQKAKHGVATDESVEAAKVMARERKKAEKKK